MSHLSIRERFLLFLRLLTIAVSITALCLYLSSHAHAQNRLSATDAVQNTQIAELSAQKAAQDASNASTEAKIENLESTVSRTEGIAIGGMATLGIVQALQVVLQLRRKP